jgi:hypothetical protein
VLSLHSPRGQRQLNGSRTILAFPGRRVTSRISPSHPSTPEPGVVSLTGSTTDKRARVAASYICTSPASMPAPRAAATVLTCYARAMWLRKPELTGPFLYVPLCPGRPPGRRGGRPRPNGRPNKSAACSAPAEPPLQEFLRLLWCEVIVPIRIILVGSHAYYHASLLQIPGGGGHRWPSFSGIRGARNRPP